MNKLEIFESDYEHLYDKAVEAGVLYLRDNPKIQSLVLGVSGGVDSAVTAAIARKVANAADRDIKLIGHIMPLPGNKEREMGRAWAVIDEYCHIHNMVDLRDLYLSAVNSIDQSLASVSGGNFTHDERVLLGNIKARVRMINLYHTAGKNNGMVLSTDNLTEFYLGFWTLHGDVGDFGFIQRLWKTEVFGLADHIGGPVAECAKAVPTDGLGITDSDIDQLLPHWAPDMGDYREAYRVIDELLIDRICAREVDHSHPVIQRYEATHFKRNNPISVPRSFYVGE